MKIISVVFAVLLAAVCWSCGDSHYSSDYDADLCKELAVKIDTGASLTQADYTAMIGQNEAILKYLIEKSDKIDHMPDSAHYGAWRILLADPEYMERFSYMFTLGSALYEAHTNNNLDEDNAKLYDGLDKYNEELAAISDRN